jgi:hypothetical protein
MVGRGLFGGGITMPMVTTIFMAASTDMSDSTTWLAGT